MGTLGERLKKFAVEHYGNSTKLAQEIGMSVQSMSLYINNKREPGAGILLRLEKLGCSIDWLLTGKIKGNELVNKYPIYANIGSTEILGEVVLPYHKSEGMYCLYIDGDNDIQSSKRFGDSVLLIDSTRSIREYDEVVVLDNKGKAYFGMFFRSYGGGVAIFPVDGVGKHHVFGMEGVKEVHRVVIRLTKYESPKESKLIVTSATVIPSDPNDRKEDHSWEE